uniref:Uncharacterized protein n=1 Tax=viral metagenome TaxID=1070528 RepID=A0A6C0DPE7_9ZZZZ
MNYIKLIKKNKYFILAALLFILFLLFLYFLFGGFKQKTYKEKFDPNNKDIIFVTAFSDIGRDKWSHSKRTNDQYFSWFYNLADNIEYKLLVFIDDDIRDELFSKYSFRDNIEFYNRSDANTFLDNETYLQREQMILDSDEFKNKIPQKRLGKAPETWNAKYNLSGHSKVNYIKRTKELYPDYTFYSWIDFGYVRNNINNVPRNLQIDKIPPKIVGDAFYIPDKKLHEHEVLQINNSIFKGGGIIVHKHFVESFHDNYEQKLIHWQNNYICDDDESAFLQLYFDDPHSFHIITDKSWFSIYKHFMSD